MCAILFFSSRVVALARSVTLPHHRSFQIPCFGAQENISSWDWWFHVFTETYLNTINDYFMDEDVSYCISLARIPDCFTYVQQSFGRPKVRCCSLRPTYFF